MPSLIGERFTSAQTYSNLAAGPTSCVWCPRIPIAQMSEGHAMSDRWIDIPDQVRRDPTAEEILRVWRASDRQVFSARVEHWDDPAAWGLLLADLTRHFARSYAE